MNSYHKHSFPNGLELITVPMPGVKSATVMVMIGAGSRYETKRINGLSHFLEHMAFKGSKKRPSALAISSAIDAIGGEFNAFTGKDHTGFYVKARADHIPLLIDVLSDMILNPLLREEEIEREKGVIIEEIHLYEDTPMRHIGDVYEDLLYGDTPLGWDTAGKPEIIRGIKRRDFTTYMEGLYRPNNAVMVVAGGIEGHEKDVIKMVERSLESWEKAKTWQFKKVADKQTKPAARVVYKDTEQAHLALGVRGYHLNHPKRYAINLLGAILGGGMSSRLFIEVRERRGLGYYVHSSADHYIDVGSFTTQAGVDVKRIEDAIQVVREQYEAVAQKTMPVTRDELAKAKEYTNGRMTLELEDSRSVAGFYATQEILKRKVRTPEEVVAKTNQVTVGEVQEVAAEIFKQNQLNLAIIGPFKDQSKFEKLLH